MKRARFVALAEPLKDSKGHGIMLLESVYGRAWHEVEQSDWALTIATERLNYE